jgi:signal transduction histidine kinase
LDRIVNETLATFEPKLRELGFQIERDLKVSQPRALDRGSVEQILVNLISNVEKYAVEGKYLCLATRAEDERVIIDVIDHGPGIPTHWQQRIFEPFVRLTDRLVDPTGTGIGLSIARELARRQGGSCDLITSSVGATFRCELPAPLV